MSRAHVVDAQDLMVDESFDEIEHTPAEEKCAGNHPAGGGRGFFPSGPKQKRNACDGEQPDREVEKPSCSICR